MEPTNGELAIIIQAQGREAKDAHVVLTTSLGRVEGKVDKTNGRVTRLEAAKNMGLGGLIITNVILIPVALVLLEAYLRNK